MKSKLSTILLSVAIAFGLWMYVITSVSPGSEETYYNIPVVMDGESVLAERNLMITQSSATNVTLKLSGNRTDLYKVNSQNITLKSDLSKVYDEGTHHIGYSIAFPGDVASNAFEVVSQTPKYITITVERRVTKPVPVEVKWIGSTPEGFMSDRENRVLDYSEITISGPASVADLIQKAVIEVDLNEQRESIDEHYRYTLCDAEGNPVDAQMIKTNTEEVRLEVRIRRIKEVTFKLDITFGGGANRGNTEIVLDTTSIRVSGSEAALDALGDTITLGKINMAEIPRGKTIPFTISLPEGVTNETGITEVNVTVKFNGLGIREFSVADIRAINVPEGIQVDIITEKLAVTLRGPAADVAKIKEADLYAVVDFSNAAVGESSTIYAQIIIDNEIKTVGPLGTYTVLATMTEM
jgi:YbbR domain-containing protein